MRKSIMPIPRNHSIISDSIETQQYISKVAFILFLFYLIAWALEVYINKVVSLCTGKRKIGLDVITLFIDV